MPWSRRNLKKKYKGVKWINTRFARPYKARLFFRMLMMAMGVRAGIFQLNRIRSQRTSTPMERANKAAAMAEAVVAIHQGFSKDMDQFYSEHGRP